MKEFLKNNKKYLKETAIIIIVGIIINIACFLMPLVVHAANSEESVLPYLPNSYENTLSRPELVDIIGTLSSAGVTLGDNTIIFRTYEYQWYTYNDYIQCPAYVIYDFSNINNFGNLTYYGCTYDSFEYNNSNMYVRVGTSDTSGITRYTIVKKSFGETYNGYYLSTQQNAYFDMFGDATMTLVSNRYFEGEFNNKYPVYCTFVLKDLNGNDVLSNYHDVVPETSDFEPAPNSPNVTPNTPPTSPTITLPSIDSSQSLIDNIKALFNWLGETIKSLLAWLIEYIMYFFNNLTYNIKSFIDAVIHAINNGFANVYNNIRDFFSPALSFLMACGKSITEFFDEQNKDFFAFCKARLSDFLSFFRTFADNLITIQTWLINMGNAILHPYDKDQIELYIDRSTFVTSCRTLSTNLTNFVTNFFDVAEPQTLTFTLDFRNAYYNFGQCEISFDWINPFKTPIRACLVGLLCLSVLNNLIEDLPSMFSGGGSHSKGTSK